MKWAKTLKVAAQLVAAGAVAVVEDDYDQMRRRYLALQTAEEEKEFRELLEKTEKHPWNVKLADAMYTKFQLSPVMGHRFVYENGKWAYALEEMLDDDFSRRDQADDEDWFDNQREHFARLDNPASVQHVPQLWEDAVQEEAIRIAASEGHAPEEADFNTAMITLHEQIPPEVMNQLRKDLGNIERGVSSD